MVEKNKLHKPILTTCASLNWSSTERSCNYDTCMSEKNIVRRHEVIQNNWWGARECLVNEVLTHQRKIRRKLRKGYNTQHFQQHLEHFYPWWPSGLPTTFSVSPIFAGPTLQLHPTTRFSPTPSKSCLSTSKLSNILPSKH